MGDFTVAQYKLKFPNIKFLLTYQKNCDILYR